MMLLLLGVGYVVIFRPDVIESILGSIASAVPEGPPATPSAPAQIAVGEPNPATPPPAEDEKPAEDKKAADEKPAADAEADVAYAWYQQNRARYKRYPNYFETTRKITIA